MPVNLQCCPLSEAVAQCQKGSGSVVLTNTCVCPASQPFAVLLQALEAFDTAKAVAMVAFSSAKEVLIKAGKQCQADLTRGGGGG